MKKRSFKFSNSGMDIVITVDAPRDGFVMCEMVNPYSKTEFSSLVPVDDFLKDIQSLLPRKVSNDIEEDLHFSLMNTIMQHIEKHGRIVDADCCTYMTYHYLIASQLNIYGNLDINDKREGMLSFIKSMEQEGLPLEYSNFGKL